MTRGAARAAAFTDLLTGPAVTSRAGLVAQGWTYSEIDSQLAARRWQLCGRAVVLHNGPLQPEESAEAALVNCGPRAALTGFTLAEARGLRGWHRDAIHVLVPAGARIVRPPGLALRVHWSGRWAEEDVRARRHALEPALVLAAGTFPSARPACGLLAAGVQQRLTTADRLRGAIAAAPRLRHHHDLGLAIADIAQGAEALSEIDFARLGRRHHLPAPLRQAVRPEPSGRRRYLDAEFRTATGRRLVVEIDGALHLAADRWWDDQLRQNELVLSGRLVLRFPSVVVRLEELLVVDQLRRALAL
jgi:hypothetical protein